MGRPPLPPGLVATTTSLRLTPAYRAALTALVEDENARALEQGLAARASETDVMRSLILRAFRDRGLRLADPTMPGGEVFAPPVRSPAALAPPAAPAATPPPVPALEAPAPVSKGRPRSAAPTPKRRGG